MFYYHETWQLGVGPLIIKYDCDKCEPDWRIEGSKILNLIILFWVRRLYTVSKFQEHMSIGLEIRNFFHGKIIGHYISYNFFTILYPLLMVVTLQIYITPMTIHYDRFKSDSCTEGSVQVTTFRKVIFKFVLFVEISIRIVFYFSEKKAETRD